MQNLKRQNDEILAMLYEIRSLLKDVKPMGDFLKLSDVMKATGKKKTSIYQEMKEGSFPQQIKTGKESVAWDANEIVRWKQAKINNRSVTAANDNNRIS